MAIDSFTNRGITPDAQLNYATTSVPSGLTPDQTQEWAAFLRVSRASILDDVLTIRSFSGSDTQVLLYLPPNDDESNPARKYGYVEKLETLQTLTISSHRPPAAARRLGRANATYARGVRTFAGSLIFNRTDRGPFLNLYGKCNKERPDLYPFFVDQLPPFHIIIHAQNEMGIQASMAILYCQLSDTGQPFSVDDLTQEDSYSYVCEYVQPFMDRDNWRNRIRSIVSQVESGNLRASSLKPSDQQDIAISFMDTDHKVPYGYPEN